MAYSAVNRFLRTLFFDPHKMFTLNDFVHSARPDVSLLGFKL